MPNPNPASAYGEIKGRGFGSNISDKSFFKSKDCKLYLYPLAYAGGFFYGEDIKMPTEIKNAPEGYKLGEEVIAKGYYPNEGYIRGEQTGDFFLLTNRAFAKIDAHFKHLPSMILRELTSKHATSSPVVLDAGGGMKATAARDLGERFPGIKVISVDLMAEEFSEGNVEARRGDLFTLPVSDRSIALLYSHEVLPHIAGDYQTRRLKAVSEMGRKLEPGGIALVDDDYIAAFPENDNRLKFLGRELGGVTIKAYNAVGGSGAAILIARHPVSPRLLSYVDQQLGARQLVA